MGNETAAQVHIMLRAVRLVVSHGGVVGEGGHMQPASFAEEGRTLVEDASSDYDYDWRGDEAWSLCSIRHRRGYGVPVAGRPHDRSRSRTYDRRYGRHCWGGGERARCTEQPIGRRLAGV